MGSLYIKEFTYDGSIAIPAGVTRVRVQAIKNRSPIIAGSRQSHFADAGGNVWGWGINYDGALSVLGVGGATAAYSSPVLITANLSGLKVRKMLTVDGSGFNTGCVSFALTEQGTLYSWGYSIYNLGTGDASGTGRSTPTLVLGGQRFADVVPHSTGAFAITPNGQAYAWGSQAGSSGHGYLGVGDDISHSSPVLVVGGLTWTQCPVSAGQNASAGLVGTTAYGWGSYPGDGTLTSKSSPVAVVGGYAFKKLYAGQGNSIFGLTTGGALYNWGFSSVGSAGTGSDSVTNSSPVLVLGGQTWSQIFTNPFGQGESGREVNYGLNTSGALYAWGYNAQGACGTGDTTNRSSPTLVVGGYSFSQVIHCGRFAFGLLSDGTAYGWGENAKGQLGVGDATSRSSPTLVLGSYKFAYIAAYNSSQNMSAYQHVFGITTDGKLMAWGYNADGQLGDASVTSRSSPVLVVAAGGRLADLTKDIQETFVTVTPGTTYTLTMAQYYATFNSQVVGTNWVDRVIISYEQ